MESRIKRTKFGMTIADNVRHIDYIVVEEHTHYVRAQRIFKEGEVHNADEYRCFSLGDLVTMGLEDGEEAPAVLMEDW